MQLVVSYVKIYFKEQRPSKIQISEKELIIYIQVHVICILTGIKVMYNVDSFPRLELHVCVLSRVELSVPGVCYSDTQAV